MRFYQRVCGVVAREGVSGLARRLSRKLFVTGKPLQQPPEPAEPAPEPDWAAFCRREVEQKRLDEITAISKGMQLLLTLKYRELLHQRIPLPRFDDVEFRCFSQNGEDGILLYLFSLLGTVNRMAVEICAGNGAECNAANLIVNHGWQGLLFDGCPLNIAYGKAFYAACRDTCICPPTLAQAWITADGINALIEDHGFSGEIDLLSLDLDGIDYWVWRAIECIQPRVVVLEFNPIWGPDWAVTVPLQDDFRLDFSREPYYCGASLAAFVKLARYKGYRLVGCQRMGFNAFFVRNGVGDDLFPEVPAAPFLKHARDDCDWGERTWVHV
jgi:hypothetical protein